ncbi:outer membrane lipoprotein Slp [Desulfarculus baarsii DSM 2075]|uniref:Outer membrane lipoprotein Slp n=1 Tax=Desulfarculus baarsii (strain ATCC 33931 / DSM 2075 / LMG 7858 / VKM B-1802 / 2st14) TaxID=644282 RepID=E1QKJ1_DESB2|nr:Slp/YeaY family lipoprotein [Desulfarculus baarsii]ADK86084.1 outer membrane lipoprotein Slp [Desulfarculus baarsii DSM 2075]
MRPWIVVVIMALALAATGCAKPVVPVELAQQASLELTLAQVKAEPAQATGKLVLWGGRIVRTVLQERGTLLEVAQFPLDSSQRPLIDGRSQGRFIVAMTGYLEPFEYYAGREVTVVGQVVAVESLPYGKVKMPYAILRGKEVYAWPPRPVPNYPTPEAGFGLGVGDPFWWDGPFMWW